MKLRKTSVVAAALTGLLATTLAIAPAALAAPPAWEPDANGNGGTLSFYDAAGNQVTGGTDLSHLFDYAVASSAEEDGAFHKASLAFAYPDAGKPTSAWFVNGGTASTAYPVASGPASITGLPATTPVTHPGPTEMNLSAALGGAILDTTPGYANVVQIRMQQSGATASYWSADIRYDTVAGTWTEIYPAASSAVSTATTLSAAPATHQTGGKPVTLTAAVSPAGAAGSVQFKDGGTNLGAPVAVTSGSAQLTTSALSAGTHSLTAVFSPTDPNAFAASSSAAVSYAVQDAAALTISRSTAVRYGAATATSTVLKDTRTGRAVAGAAVKLYARTSPSRPWALAASATTSAGGVAAKAVRPAGRTYYQWRFAGSSALAAATSPTQTVSVAPVLTARASRTKVKHGTTIKVYGTVAPASAGQKVTLQRLVGRTWKAVTTVTVKRQKLPNGKTAVGYVASVKLSARGTYKFRTYKAATSSLLAGNSATVSVKAT